MKKIILIVALCFVGFHVNAMENSILGVGNEIDLSQGYHDPYDSNNKWL